MRLSALAAFAGLAVLFLSTDIEALNLRKIKKSKSGRAKQVSVSPTEAPTSAPSDVGTESWYKRSLAQLHKESRAEQIIRTQEWKVRETAHEEEDSKLEKLFSDEDAKAQVTDDKQLGEIDAEATEADELEADYNKRLEEARLTLQNQNADENKMLMDLAADRTGIYRNSETKKSTLTDRETAFRSKLLEKRDGLYAQKKSEQQAMEIALAKARMDSANVMAAGDRERQDAEAQLRDKLQAVADSERDERRAISEQVRTLQSEYDTATPARQNQLREKLTQFYADLRTASKKEADAQREVDLQVRELIRKNDAARYKQQQARQDAEEEIHSSKMVNVNRFSTLGNHVTSVMEKSAINLQRALDSIDEETHSLLTALDERTVEAKHEFHQRLENAKVDSVEIEAKLEALMRRRIKIRQDKSKLILYLRDRNNKRNADRGQRRRELAKRWQREVMSHIAQEKAFSEELAAKERALLEAYNARNLADMAAQDALNASRHSGLDVDDLLQRVHDAHHTPVPPPPTLPPTEAPTEAPTDPPTEAPTEPPVVEYVTQVEYVTEYVDTVPDVGVEYLEPEEPLTTGYKNPFAVGNFYHPEIQAQHPFGF